MKDTYMYTEDTARAGEYLRLTLSSLAKHNLMANPVNYTVWYDAVSGKNNKLKRVLDQMVESGEPLNDQNVQALYQKFVTDGDRLVIARLLIKVNLMLREISSHVAETKGDLAGHGKTLDSLAGELESVGDLGGIREIIDRMLEETRALISSGDRLQTRMKVSSGDLQQLQKELDDARKQAMTDGLTGLANRRGLEKHMELERIRARQNNAPFAVILLDIDLFKRINDTFGHLVGDSLLKGVAQILNAQTRGNDFVARFGGEEFLVMLPETDETGARAVAGKVKSVLEKKEWRVKDSGKVIGRVTASMGIALYRLGEPGTQVIQRADAALYRAKDEGRNAIVVYSGE